jgi:translation initiation factor 1A
MVKNVKGGNHKFQARKNTVSTNVVRTRLAKEEEEAEIYAKVLKLLGNGMCHVLCQDGITRLCIIRGKFKYKKRDNTLTNNKWVLVGLRDFASQNQGQKMESCDLLEIYSDQDKERLKTQVSTINWKIFNDISSSANTEEDNGLVFSEDACNQEEYKAQIEKNINRDTTNNNHENTGTIHMDKDKDEEPINIDDI